MGKSTDLHLTDQFTIDGDLFEFDRVNVTSQMNGDILKDVNVHTTLGGEYTNNIQTNLLDKIQAVIHTTLGGEFTNQIKTDILDKMKADVGISVKDLAPLLLTLLWTEIPIVKFRVPHDYTFGFRFFGIEFFSVRFRGESKAVTAKNPNGATGGIDV